uniref:BRO1 domain-containing protein n=1 Tax=Kalanchoe fedtschenkoi TaxID=63787 RepID=A0A7N0VBM1_KALFE
MGCAWSLNSDATAKACNIPEVAVFVPSLRFPVQSDVHKAVKGLIPLDLADKLSRLRNHIVFMARDTGGSAIKELSQALHEYLPYVIGLTKKDHGLQEMIEFKWKHAEEKRQEVCVANSWFEVLSVVHMMAMVSLAESNLLLIPKGQATSGERVVSTDNKREAVNLLLKAAGYLKFCLEEVLVYIPADIKRRLPRDFHEGVLESISLQALGQGTEIQLGLAVECPNATLSVKRRLACEQLTFFSQAHYCLSGCDVNQGYGKKHLLFIKWKYLEAKAAAYYFNGLILDKGTEPLSHINAVNCFIAADELLCNSKKACLSFCVASPVKRFVYNKYPQFSHQVT